MSELKTITVTTAECGKQTELRAAMYAVMAWHPLSGWKIHSSNMHRDREAAEGEARRLTKGWRHRRIIEIPAEEIEW